MKKKIIAIVLTMIMIICNSMTVWAAITSVPSSDSHNVTASFNKDSTSSYNVTITWGSLQYSYNGNVTWNSTDKYYKASDASETGWTPTLSGTSDKITVTNDSDVGVKATLSYKENYNIGEITDDVRGVSGSFDTNTYDLSSKAISSTADIDGESILTISGAPTQINVGSLSSVTLGQVTVSLTAL